MTLRPSPSTAHNFSMFIPLLQSNRTMNLILEESLYIAYSMASDNMYQTEAFKISNQEPEFKCALLTIE